MAVRSIGIRRGESCGSNLHDVVAFDTEIGSGEGDGAVARVKVKEAGLGIDAKEGCYVGIIG